MGSTCEFKNAAQRRYTIHHSDWLKLGVRLTGYSRREAVRFVSVGQWWAGSFLNAVPRTREFRVPTWALRIAVQRRLGLPLTAGALASTQSSRHGKQFDALGDVAQNDGEQGHQTRHFLVLESLADALRRVWGARVQREPSDYRSYSDYRPDLTVSDGPDFTVIDAKVYDSVGADAGEVSGRGALVGFGNTRPTARERVLGREQRGQPGDRAFNAQTGLGYVSAMKGDYHRAAANGVRLVPALVETFGGVGPELKDLLTCAAERRQNRLTAGEYDETTWAARTWLSFVGQRFSVAVQIAMAGEIARALGLAAAGDPRAT